MTEYTVGQVAGVINIVLLFFQVTLPLLQALVLVGMLETCNSAVTWSVVGRFIHSTPLPTLVRADTAAGRRHGVSTRVVVMNYAASIIAILIAVAGVLSPIGLGETIKPGPLINATFHYAPDPTIFGRATLSRENYTVSRSCDNGYVPCPGVDPDQQSFYINRGNGYGKVVYKSVVPSNLTEYFSSGTSGHSDLRSNPFQIQFRRYWTARPDRNDTSYTNTTGDFMFIQRLILGGGYELREDVVIDTIKGGLGFRNHTVPTQPPMKHGATWFEDLLFIEPWTSCMATNWSLYSKKQITPLSFASPQITVTEAKLVRDGHVPSNIATNSNLNLDLTLSQAVDLFEQNLLASYNATNSTGALEIDLKTRNGKRTFLQTHVIFESSSGAHLFNDVSRDDEDPLRVCMNYTSITMPSIKLPFIRCGYFLPEPKMVGSNQISRDLDETLLQSLSICGTGLAATVKQVHFRYNDTGDSPSLSGLDVLDIAQKRYINDEERPLWAIENPSGNWTFNTVKLLWGIIDTSTAEKLGTQLRTIRGDHFLLPAHADLRFSGNGFGDSMGASRGAAIALDIAYSHSTARLGSYDGGRELAMELKLQNLSASMETIPLIPNLIWTDIAANMLVGTKSRLTNTGNLSALGEVRVLQQKITYKYQYGILGFICCCIWIFCALFCILLSLIPRFRSRLTIGAMRRLLNKLSVGRSLLLAKPDGDSFEMTTKEWLSKVGKIQIELSEREQASDDAKETVIEASEKGKSLSFNSHPDRRHSL